MSHKYKKTKLFNMSNHHAKSEGNQSNGSKVIEEKQLSMFCHFDLDF